MTSDHDTNYPWRCWLGGHHVGRRSTRQAAMNLVDRPWRAGAAEVRNERTGEQWLRPRGSWFKNTDAQKKTPAPAPMLDKGAATPGARSTSCAAPRAAMEVPPAKLVAPAARQAELRLGPVSSQTAGGRDE